MRLETDNSLPIVNNDLKTNSLLLILLCLSQLSLFKKATAWHSARQNPLVARACSWGYLRLCICGCVDVALGFALALAVGVPGWSGGEGWGLLASYNLLSCYVFRQWVVFVGGFAFFCELGISLS